MYKATFRKSNDFALRVANKLTSKTVVTMKMFLTADSMSPESNVASVTELTGSSGHQVGGVIVDTSLSTTDVLQVSTTIFTAGAYGLGPFKNAVLHDTALGNQGVIGWYEFEQNVTLPPGDYLLFQGPLPLDDPSPGLRFGGDVVTFNNIALTYGD